MTTHLESRQKPFQYFDGYWSTIWAKVVYYSTYVSCICRGVSCPLGSSVMRLSSSFTLQVFSIFSNYQSHNPTSPIIIYCKTKTPVYIIQCMYCVKERKTDFRTCN